MFIPAWILFLVTILFGFLIDKSKKYDDLLEAMEEEEREKGFDSRIDNDDLEGFDL